MCTVCTCENTRPVSGRYMYSQEGGSSWIHVGKASTGQVVMSIVAIGSLRGHLSVATTSCLS